MARIPLLMALPLVAAAGFFGLAYLGMQRENPDDLPSALIGQMTPGLQVTALGTNRAFTVADLQDGKVKIVNFWASWCAPCRAEHPNLLKLQAEGLPIYGINYKDAPEAALRFLAELGNPFDATVADGQGRTGIDWGIYGVPETFVIDGGGRVVLRLAGPLTERVIEGDLRPALQKAMAP